MKCRLDKLLLALAIAACGHAPTRVEKEVQPVELPQVLRDSPYMAECDRRMGVQAEAEGEERWVPPRLRARDVSGEGGFESLSHETLSQRLLSGELTSVVLEGRGGLGKTKLLQAIAALTCSRFPTFAIDANLHLPHEGDSQAILAAMEERLATMAGVPEPRVATFREAMQQGFILLIDAVDEVSLEQRDVVLRAVSDLLGSYAGKVRLVVFMRPPVYRETAQMLSAQAMVEIEQLDCGTTENRVKFLTKDEASLAAFWEYARKSGLDRKAQAKGCRYVHLSTYRDVETAVTVAQEAGFRDPDDVAGRGRAVLYERLVRIHFTHALRLAGEGAPDPLQFADMLVEAVGVGPGTRGILFSKADCLKAAKDLGGRAEPVCDALFIGPLFRKVEGRDLFALRNQSVGDLLLARFADRKVREDGRPACGRLSGLSRLFESTEVVSFLVGLPGGSACVVDLVQAMCRHGTWPVQTRQMLDQGLSDAGRKRLVEAAQQLPDEPVAGCMKEVTRGLLPE